MLRVIHTRFHVSQQSPVYPLTCTLWLLHLHTFNCSLHLLLHHHDQAVTFLVNEVTPVAPIARAFLEPRTHLVLLRKIDLTGRATLSISLAIAFSRSLSFAFAFSFSFLVSWRLAILLILSDDLHLALSSHDVLVQVLLHLPPCFVPRRCQLWLLVLQE